jgi:hypothetical protein
MEMKDFASCHAEDCLPDVGGHQDPLEAIYAAAKRREERAKIRSTAIKRMRRAAGKAN